jgi:hypothetical protein
LALLAVVVLSACSRRNSDSPTRTDDARVLLANIEARFALKPERAERASQHTGAPTGSRSRRPFGEHVARAFVPDGKGGISLAASSSDKLSPSSADGVWQRPEEVAALNAHRAHSFGGTRPHATFPAKAADGLRVQVAGRSDAWLRVRPHAASGSVRNVVDGVIVYPGMVGGADAIYAVSDERVEEFLHIHSAEQAKALVFDVDLGDGIRSLRTDGSGAGLEALGAAGEVLLRAPMPEGVDGSGRPVRGRLLAERLDDDRYQIRVELTGEKPTFPLLLDPSWAGTGSMATARNAHTATLLTTGKVLVAGGGTASAELYDPATGTFSVTGSMVSARGNHTATLLPSGKVFVAGGMGATFLASAEVYDPASGTFSAAGALATARDNHTATLLPSGKVVIAGGLSSSGFLASVEVYDPAAGTISATHGLATARGFHTATLLPLGQILIAGGVAVTAAEVYDLVGGTFPAGSLPVWVESPTATMLPSGKVLITGGEGVNGITASASLWDRTTGTFSATGSMVSARMNHTATLLPSGKVLVAGGNGAGSSAELYDPATGTFSATSSLTAARSQHTATLLPSGKVLATGGLSGGGAVASAEMYDPVVSGTFSATGSLAAAGEERTATLLPSGKVLVTGGWADAMDGGLSSAELYDPATGSFSFAGSLATRRFNHSATLLSSGKVLIAGGDGAPPFGTGADQTSAELYDPISGTFSTTGSLSNGRENHTATLLASGKVLVAGGGQSSEFIASAELYDPTVGLFSAAGSLANGRYGHTATLLPSGKVLIVGGVGSGVVALASAELYDPQTGTFTATGSLSAARFNHTATLLPLGKVLIAGGLGQPPAGGGPNVATAELYDPATGAFSTTGSLVTPRENHTATLLPSGKVLIAGGNGAGVGIASVELYDPALGTFSATGSLATPRQGHTATLLGSGKVLVAGGFDNNLTLGAFLASAELYDEGFGYPDSLRPVVSSMSSTTVLGSTLTISGSNLLGVGEGSAGGTASNYPLVRLMRDGSEQLVYAATSDSGGAWQSSSSTLKVALPAGMQPGVWRAQIVTNAIPSTSVELAVFATPPPLGVPATPGWAAIALAAGLAAFGTRATLRRRAAPRRGR